MCLILKGLCRAPIDKDWWAELETLPLEQCLIDFSAFMNVLTTVLVDVLSDLALFSVLVDARINIWNDTCTWI